MPTLHIKLLGPPIICIGECTCKIRSKKAEALLFYCLLSSPVGRRLFTRRHLCDVFWPEEQSETRARKNLSDTLWLLKDDLHKGGADESQSACLRGTRDTIEFNTVCGYVCDVEEFERLVCTVTEETSLEALERVYSLYHGQFLATFEIQDVHPDFETWVTARQEALASDYRQLLQRLSIRYMAQGSWSLALQCLTRLQQETPEEHAVYSLLMISYAVTGQIAQAQQTYRQYTESMHTAFHLSPHPAMDKLHRLIGARQFVPQQAQQLVEEALRTPRVGMESPFQETLTALWRALNTPLPNKAYHKVWQQAQAVAKSQGCSVVGTPHLFLALCTTHYDMEEDVRTLENVREAMLPEHLDELVRALRWVLSEYATGRRTPAQGTLELDHVLERACELAADGGDEIITPLHLWRALLQEEHGVLSQVLRRYEIDRIALLHALE